MHTQLMQCVLNLSVDTLNAPVNVFSVIWGQFSIFLYLNSTKKLNPPFHWTAIPLRFEILVKMTRIVAETAKAQ